MHPRRAMTYGLWLAAAYNIVGMLAFSQGFTNPLLHSTDPAVFSWLGQVSIILWGLAYASAARTYHTIPGLLWVFCLEKIVYGVAWLMWLNHQGHTLPQLADTAPFTALFFASYGAGDWLFAGFFAWAGWQVRQKATPA